MFRLRLLVFVLVFAPLAFAEEPKLYVREVQESTGAKPLKMRFEEIERSPKYSIVQVTHSGGASVPSIMFVVRGMWEIARAREAAYFINLKEWTAGDGKGHYKVGFADTDRVDVSSYFGESPAEPKFLSVEEFALIFGE
jgi:hypothetical protein